MKAFEEWRKHNINNLIRLRLRVEDFDADKLIWKAALEWAYKTGKDLRESAWIFDYIEKELGQDGFEKNI